MPKRCPLFVDLTPEQMQKALRLLQAQEKSHARNDLLKLAGDRMPAFGLVLSGLVSVTMQDIDGHEMLLNLVGPGQTFGEALCYLDAEAPVTITAACDARILWMRCQALREPAQEEMQRLLQRRFTAMLARRTLRMNDRIQILSRGSIREKLNAFFTECARDAGSLRFTIPYDRAGMAAYLAVDRSALSRELSRMRSEGLISYHKNEFTLHMQQTIAEE